MLFGRAAGSDFGVYAVEIARRPIIEGAIDSEVLINGRKQPSCRMMGDTVAMAAVCSGFLCSVVAVLIEGKGNNLRAVSDPAELLPPSLEFPVRVSLQYPGTFSS